MSVILQKSTYLIMGAGHHKLYPVFILTKQYTVGQASPNFPYFVSQRFHAQTWQELSRFEECYGQ